MRRAVLTVAAVFGLVLAMAAPVAADTAPGPFRESGTSKSLSSFSSDCGTQGSQTTCSDTSVDVFSIDPTTVEVCVYRATYSVNERTGQFRLTSEESGCSEVAESALDVSVSRDALTATLEPTQVTLFSCNQRTCTETDTVTVSAADSGGPVATFTNRGSFKDGTCTFRYSESGQTAEVSGTLTIDGTTLAESGGATISQFKVQQTCK